MNKWVKRMALPLVFLLLLQLLPLQVLAADEYATAKIPFTVENAPGTVVLEALDGAPLPEQAELENTTGGVFEIIFTEPGDYYYTVRQIPGYQQGYYYDLTVYEVHVQVAYSASDALEANVNTNKEGSPYKSDIIFSNTPKEKVPEERLYAYLEIEKVAKRDGVPVVDLLVGDEFYYEITLTNTGKAKAYNVTLTDILPKEEPLLIVKQDGIQDGGMLRHEDTVATWSLIETAEAEDKSVVWYIGDIMPGESKTVTFSATIPQVVGGVQWLNTAIATYGGGFVLEGGDSTAAAFTATAICSATVQTGVPHVVISKEQSVNGGDRTDELLYVVSGDEITYYITITNDSDVVVSDVSVMDEIPEGLELVEESISHSHTLNGNVIIWEPGDLKPGESITVSFTCKVSDVTEETHWFNKAKGTFGGTIDFESNEVEAVYAPTKPSTPAEPSDSTKPDEPGTTPDTSDAPEASDPSDTPETPETGDTGHLTIGFIVMILSFVGCVCLIIFDKKEKISKKHLN